MLLFNQLIFPEITRGYPGTLIGLLKTNFLGIAKYEIFYGTNALLSPNYDHQITEGTSATSDSHLNHYQYITFGSDWLRGFSMDGSYFQFSHDLCRRPCHVITLLMRM